MRATARALQDDEDGPAADLLRTFLITNFFTAKMMNLLEEDKSIYFLKKLLFASTITTTNTALQKRILLGLC
jgi:hypothetical protein